MIAHLLGVEAVPTETVQADPKCGEDFCDQCGDCLHCYWEDPCLPGGGEHAWVVYPDGVAEFKARVYGPRSEQG